MRKTKPATGWHTRVFATLALSVCIGAQAQTSIPCDNYTFPNATGWTQTGSAVAISGGAITATSAPGGFQAHYVAATLGTALTDNWTCDFQFKPTGGSAPAHSLVSFTESSAGTIYSAHGYRTVSGGTMNYTLTHCIEAYIFASTSTSSWQLCAQSKERTGGTYGTTTTTAIPWSSPGVITLGSSAAVMNTTYYARLQRLDETNGMISVFSDPGRTTLIGSDCFSIDPDIDNLDAIQSGNFAEGGTTRSFSGTVDSITVCNLAPVLNGTATFCASASAKTYVMWNGNSNVTPDCGFPGATSFVFGAPAGSTFPLGTGGSCGLGSSGYHQDCSIDVNTSGNVTCTILYSCGTSITYSFAVTVNPSPTSVITGPTSFCAGAPISLSGASSANETSYRWSAVESDAAGNPVPGGITCIPATFTAGTAGSVNLLTDLSCVFTCGKYYRVRLETKNSCATVSSQQVIYINCLPTVSVSVSPSVICPGSCANLVASGAFSYSWTPSTGLSCTNCYDPDACLSSTQVYTVTGTALSGCTDTETVTVTVSDLAVSLGSDQAICCNQTYTFAPVPTGGTMPYTYSWSYAPAGGSFTCSHSGTHSAATCPAPMFVGICPTARNFTVTVTDANGCTATDVITISPASCRLTQESTDEHSDVTVIYPNPASMQITINTTTVADQLVITDAMGRQVINVQPTSTQTQVDVSNLSPGLYFVQVISADKTETQRLIINE